MQKLVPTVNGGAVAILQCVTGLALLEKAKLAREISDGKNEIPHKFFGRKI